jgi:probable phosphoglycerate mutase
VASDNKFGLSIAQKESGNVRKVYIIAHTESLHHIQGLGGGWFDTSLTEKGKEQARKIAVNLSETLNVTEIPIYSSDLKRACEVADILQEVFGGPVFKDQRLREMCFGEAEGKDKNWQSVNFKPPSTGNNRMDHRVYQSAESRRELAARIMDFMYDLEDKSEENAILVTHGFALTFIVLSWLKVPIENMGYANFRSSPGGVTLLVEDDVFHNREVSYLNNTDFMK